SAVDTLRTWRSGSAERSVCAVTCKEGMCFVKKQRVRIGWLLSGGGIRRLKEGCAIEPSEVKLINGSCKRTMSAVRTAVLSIDCITSDDLAQLCTRIRRCFADGCDDIRGSLRCLPYCCCWSWFWGWRGSDISGVCLCAGG